MDKDTFEDSPSSSSSSTLSSSSSYSSILNTIGSNAESSSHPSVDTIVGNFSIPSIEPEIFRSNIQKITLNARGFKYEVILNQLAKLPNSRLFKLRNCILYYQDQNFLYQLCDDFDLNTNEFYFNKDPQVLNLILSFYATASKPKPNPLKDIETQTTLLNKIHFNINNTNLCVFQLEEEFNYWNIDYDELIEPCCLLRLNREREFISEELKKEEKIISKLNFKVDFGTRCFPELRKKAWNLFDNPSSSVAARIVQLISIVLIILPTITLVISTLPDFQVKQAQSSTPVEDISILVDNSTSSISVAKKTSTAGSQIDKVSVQEVFYIFEIITTSWFTLDYIVRILSTPTKKVKFILNPLNIIDLVSNVPFYLELILSEYQNIGDIKNMLRLFQIMRIIRLARHSTGLRSLGYTFSKSRNELLLLGVLLGICLLVFSSLAYFFEKDQTGTTFVSIPSALWWALVTMTSVGYGDMLPMTIPGKIIAGSCAVLGLMIIAMPVAIISSNFGDFYAKKTKIEKIKKRNDRKKRKEKLKKLEKTRTFITPLSMKSAQEQNQVKPKKRTILRKIRKIVYKILKIDGSDDEVEVNDIIS